MKSKLAAFVEAIRQSDLVGTEHVDYIARLAAHPTADPQAIAKEIVQRGWLTAYQVRMFWKGRGRDLFLNQYVLLEPLGEGGMGEVYKARHRKMERDVALKVIRKERLAHPGSIVRFQREIQAAAQLTHENVVMAYDAAQSGDRHFFAMEYVEGINLSKLVKEQGPLPVMDACNYIRQAALGLQHAHEKGMVHRDIKPSNLLLSKTKVVKILDMGLARLQETSSTEPSDRITQEGLIVGTPDYLAPEQARNARNADIRSDIYSLGCTFFYLLAGRPPFPEGTATEKLLRHSMDPVPLIARNDVPPVVEQIIQRMLAKDPAHRFQTPAEVAYALEPFCGLPGSTSSIRRPQLPPIPGVPQATAPMIASYAITEQPPSTESEFRLPPPSPLRRLPKKPDRTRWFVPIAILVSLAALGAIAYGIYAIMRKAPPTGPQWEAKFSNRFDMEFLLIAAGSFEMGSPDSEVGHQEDEGPVHTIQISKPFYMSRTEVSIRQYQAVMGNLPEGVSDAEEDLDRPMILTQIDALNFIRKLSSIPNSGLKEGWEFRLPSEAQWEYACRAGTRSRFAYGDELSPDNALYGDKQRTIPDKVGQRSANLWGLHDMHGNVAEWCLDRYDENFYGKSPAIDPLIITGRAKAVVRGGAWNNDMVDCRSARRRAEYPEKPGTANVGFRVVMVQVGK